MALTWNQHEVAAMEAYARGLGLPFSFDSLLNPRVDCGANRNGELQLTAEQAGGPRPPGRARAHAGLPGVLRGLRAAGGGDQGAEYVYSCGAGAGLLHRGPLRPAPDVPALAPLRVRPAGRQSFARGWNEHFPELRARKWQTQSICRTCNLISLCGSCPGAAEMETGTIEGVVPRFCEIAHLAGLHGHGRVLRAPARRDVLPGPRRAGRAGAGGGRGPGAGRLRLLRARRARPAPYIQIQRPALR